MSLVIQGFQRSSASNRPVLLVHSLRSKQSRFDFQLRWISPAHADSALTWRAEKSQVHFSMKTEPRPLPTIKQILDEHVTLTVESLDRLYLNGYVPTLQTGAGLKRYLVHHWKFPVASPALLGQLTKRYVQQVDHDIQKHEIPVVPFKKGERSHPGRLPQPAHRLQEFRLEAVFQGGTRLALRGNDQ